MSENTSNNKNVRDDEIDLLDLFRRMGIVIRKWMNALGRGVLISVVFLFRKSLWLALSLIIGIAIAFIMKTLADKVYSSEITIRSNTVPNSDMITYINRLHTFSLEGDSASLSTSLNLSPDETQNILDIQAFWAIDLAGDGVPDKVDYKDKYDPTDTINIRMTDRLVVRVKLVDNKEYSPLTGKIISYINQNQLFQQKNQVRIAQNIEIRERLIYDINQLDSLQKVKYFEETRNRQPKSGGQMIFLQEQNTQLIYSDIYALYDRKQSIDAELELYKDVVTLLNDFTQPARPINGLLFYGKLVIPLLLIFSLILLVFFENINKIKEIYKRY